MPDGCGTLQSEVKRLKMDHRSARSCFSYRRGRMEFIRRVGKSGTALEEQVESYPNFVLYPEKEVLGRLDAEIGHLESALATDPESSLLEANPPGEALDPLDACDRQAPLNCQERIVVLAHTERERGRLHGLDDKVDSRKAVRGKRLVHVLVTAVAAGGNGLDLHAQISRHALTQIAGIGLEVPCKVPSEPAEVPGGKARIEGHEALARYGHPVCSLRNGREGVEPADDQTHEGRHNREHGGGYHALWRGVNRRCREFD